MIHNAHERSIEAPLSSVGRLLDSLGSDEDGLWPRREWPPMRLDRPLGAGARGGHGPVRYVVTGYDPGRSVDFRFTGPAGFNGHHSFTAVAGATGSTLLAHTLTLKPTGWARLTWPLFFRPLHDALIEEALDHAERAYGTPPSSPHRRSPWVRVLRAMFGRRRDKLRKSDATAPMPEKEARNTPR